MQESSEWRLAGVLGWILVAVPSALFLAFTAWVMTYKLGVTGGITYAVALALWATLMIWRWRRTQ